VLYILTIQLKRPLEIRTESQITKVYSLSCTTNYLPLLIISLWLELSYFMHNLRSSISVYICF